MDQHYVYLIACRGQEAVYVKIGLTSSIKRRLANIQTGCPHPIVEAFVILSEYREEVEGLEKLLHILLKPQYLRAEWYLGNDEFFSALEAVLHRVNAGGFSYEEIEALPDFAGPELEVILHRHNFNFRRVMLPLPKAGSVIGASEAMKPREISLHLRKQAPTPAIERTEIK